MVSVPRSVLLTALVGVILACVGALWAGGEATRRLAVERAGGEALDELALLANLSAEDGRLLRDEPLAVEVIQDGGPLWVREAIVAAVETNAYFEEASSSHLLRVEVIDVSAGVGLQLHLWRAGWELRVPEPRRIRVAPWAPVIAAVLGALAAVLSRRVSVGLGVAGVGAQLLLGVDRLPRELFPPRPLLETWSEGPLIRRALELVDNLGSGGLAVAAGVLTVSVVLVAFDHRRSKQREDSLSLGAALLAAGLISVGLLGWVEAASRASLFTALRHGAGWLALVGLGLAWWPAVRLAWEERRASA